MKILVSNDDGLYANGIRALVEALSVKNEVYIVAPDRERSAAGHALTLHTPLRVDEIEGGKYGAKRTWFTSGTPGDCVKIGVSAILSREERPDLVISGINHGPNLGSDILYSGTVSCAMEGAMMGIPSVAVSLNSNSTEYEDFKYAADFVAALIPKLREFQFPYKSILNINVPGIDSEDILGVSITEMGGRMFTDNYEKRVDPRGKTYYWMAGEITTEPEDAMTDIAAVRNNRISVTPVTFEMTRKTVMADLNRVLCKDNLCNWF